jgi:hypothetical protein
VVRRRGGNGVAIFPRPRSRRLRGEMWRKRFKPSLGRAEEAARLGGSAAARLGGFCCFLVFDAYDLGLFKKFHEL